MTSLGFTLLSFAASVLVALDPMASDAIAIPAGHEEAIERLFLPYATDREVLPGVRFDAIRIEGDHVGAFLAVPGSSAVEVRFTRVAGQPRAGDTASFAVEVRGDPSPTAREAANLLVAAVRTHDDGTFWKDKRPRTIQAPTPAGSLRAVLTDGVLLLVGLAVILAWLVGTNLGDGRGTLLVLAAITLAGALLRWLLAPETTLDTFPYFRTNEVARLVYEGPILRHLNAALGGILHVNEVAFTVTFLLAAATPLGAFVLARALGATPPAALWAAAVLAILPGHVRFSHSETPFIPTLLVACLVFGLAALAGNSPSRRARGVALVLFVLLAWWVSTLRALAFLYPLLALALIVPAEGRRRRALALALGLGAVVLALAVPAALRTSQQTAVTLGLGDVGRVLANAVDPACNTLLNVRVTPPLVLLAALFGLVVWFRHAVKAPLVLVLWLGLLVASHAVAVSPTVALQSRYNLLLLPALAVLAGVGLDAATRRHRWGVVAGASLLALAPLPHLAYVTDVAFSDQQEYDFVRAVRERVPDGCTVVEVVGDGSGESEATSNARFRSLGVVLKAGEIVRRFESFALYDPRETGPSGGGVDDAGKPSRRDASVATVEDGLRQLATSPPECLYVYEGLPCFEENGRPVPLSAACAAVRQRLALTPVASLAAPRRGYDRPAPREEDAPHTASLTFTLYRGDARREPIAPRGRRER